MLIQISLLISTVLALAACSGEGADPTKIKSPYAGIWVGKDAAVVTRQSKDLETNCNQLKSTGYVKALLIDSNGSIFDYEIINYKEQVKKIGSVDRDGKITILRTAEKSEVPDARAAIQGDNLTITVLSGMAFHVHYTKSTKTEVANLGAVNTLCKLDTLTGDL